MKRDHERMRPIVLIWLYVLAGLMPHWLAIYLDHEGINKSFHRIVFLFFYVVALALIQKTRFRALNVVFIAVLSISTTISVTCGYFYGSPFNEAFAWSLLHTNTSEFWGMAKIFWPAIMALVLVHVTTIGAIKCLSSAFAHQKYFKLLGMFLLVFSGAVAAQATIKEKKVGLVFHPASAALRKTSFHNFSYLIDAAKRSEFIATYADKKYIHKLTANNFPTLNNIVIVIGESATRSHHSLYGYPRTTTPQLDALAAASVVFDQAIAPAAYTLLAVPLSLNTASAARPTPEGMFDSIFDIATMLGYQSHWISLQGQSGPDDSTITAIARKATTQNRLSGPDELALSALKQILPAEGKNLFIVHLNGSHEPPCGKVPSTQFQFTGGDTEDDCYDSTIRYTDTILGEMAHALRATPSALLYYSDHGLIKGRGGYMHAAGTPPPAAVDVPMMLWFSPAAKHPRQGSRIAQPYATDNNYYLIAHLMGAYVDDQQCFSALSGCYDFSSPVWVSDTSGAAHLYANLK